MQVAAESLELQQQQDRVRIVDLLSGVPSPARRSTDDSVRRRDLVQRPGGVCTPGDERMLGHRRFLVSVLGTVKMMPLSHPQLVGVARARNTLPAKSRRTTRHGRSETNTFRKCCAPSASNAQRLRKGWKESGAPRSRRELFDNLAKLVGCREGTTNSHGKRREKTKPPRSASL
jgi:hypothetical protein